MNITRRDWLMAMLVALGAIVLVSIPYALGYVTTLRDLYYTGIVMNPEDSQSYFAKMLEGYDGNWLYTIPFTPEPHAPAFVGGFYLALGHAARVLGLPLDAMWHLARVAADLAMFLTTFGFIAIFLREPRARWTAYALALFGSGLGWVLFLLNQTNWLDFFPVDFKMPEAHLFFTALTFPHVALGTALILASFWLTLRALERSRWRAAIAAGLANLGIAIVYPFLIYLIVATLAVFLGYRILSARHVLWRNGLLIATALFIPAPLVLYYAITLNADSVFRAWEAQSLLPSPAFPHYLLAYGAMLVFGLPILWRKRDEFAFLGCWLVAAALLVYAPMNSQRRFVQGIQVPLAILASLGWFAIILPWIERTRAFQALAARPRYSSAGLGRLLTIFFIAFMSLSNVYVLASVSVTASVEKIYPLFRARAEVDAVDWLRTHTPRTAVTLGGYETGNFIAARAGNRVVLGHWAETLNWDAKMDEVGRFYRDSTDDAWRRDLLVRYRITYVFFGPRERALGHFEPTQDTVYLERIFRNDAVSIYRVVNP